MSVIQDAEVLIMTVDQLSDIKELDHSVRNRFRLDWLQKIVSSNDETYSLGECIRKVNVPGQAFCIWCNDIISYGSQGCKSLVTHTKSKKHIERAIAVPNSAGVAETDSSSKAVDKKSQEYTVLLPGSIKQTDLKELDSSVKNRFRLNWLQKQMQVGDLRYRLRDCFQKVNLPGYVLCAWCNDLVNYGSSGAKALETHVRTRKHIDRAVVVLGSSNADEDSLDEAENEKPVYCIEVGDVKEDSTGASDNSTSASESKKQFTLTRRDCVDLQLLEGSVKNRFRWEWLDKIATDVEVEYRFSDCLKKIDAPGQVMCIWCDRPIDYSGSGAKALDSHVKTRRHIHNARRILKTQSLISSEPGDTGADAESSNLTESGLLLKLEEDKDIDKTICSPVIEETIVKEYIKMIKCREYIIRKKNMDTGQVVSESYRKEEDEPVISDVSTTTYESVGSKLQTITKTKRPVRSALSHSVAKRRCLARTSMSSKRRCLAHTSMSSKWRCLTRSYTNNKYRCSTHTCTSSKDITDESSRSISLSEQVTSDSTCVRQSSKRFKKESRLDCSANNQQDVASASSKQQARKQYLRSFGDLCDDSSTWTVNKSSSRSSTRPLRPVVSTAENTSTDESYQNLKIGKRCCFQKSHSEERTVQTKNTETEGAFIKTEPPDGAEYNVIKQEAVDEELIEGLQSEAEEDSEGQEADTKDSETESLTADEDGSKAFECDASAIKNEDLLDSEAGEADTKDSELGEADTEDSEGEEIVTKDSEAESLTADEEDSKASATKNDDALDRWTLGDQIKLEKVMQQPQSPTKPEAFQSNCWCLVIGDNCNEWHDCPDRQKGSRTQAAEKKHLKTQSVHSSLKQKGTGSWFKQCNDCKRLYLSCKQFLKHKAKGHCSLGNALHKKARHVHEDAST